MTRLLMLTTALGLAVGGVAMPDAALAKEKTGKHCPPGLAKKNPACVPPGLANKGVRYEDDRDHDDDDEYVERDDDDRLDIEDYDDLRSGDRVVIDGREYEVFRIGDGVVLRREEDVYRLPRIDDGSDYVRVGDAIVRVDRKTKAAIQIIELTDLILG